MKIRSSNRYPGTCAFPTCHARVGTGQGRAIEHNGRWTVECAHHPLPERAEAPRALGSYENNPWFQHMMLTESYRAVVWQFSMLPREQTTVAQQCPTCGRMTAYYRPRVGAYSCINCVPTHLSQPW